MTIEKANIDENEILSEITKKSKAFWGYSREQILKWDNNLTITKDYIKKYDVFKLEIDEKIIGYYSYIKKGNYYVKLDNLFILPEYIGKGFGKLLMNDFLDRIRKENTKKIILNSEPNAEKFYSKIGFQKIGEFETSIKNRFMPIMELKIENSEKNLDFEIEPNGEISKTFLYQNILTFKDATIFIKELKYGRNENKNDLTSIFNDNCGTCSTKHAILKKLADENNYSDIKLILGIFKMSASNTKKIKETLEKNNLDYIPEAHNYLKYENEIFDFTSSNSKTSDFEYDLLEEIEILPNQITSFKVDYHKNYLQKWLNENNEIKLTLDELWRIREKCIENLSK